MPYKTAKILFIYWTDTLLEQAVFILFLVLMICGKDTSIVKF